MKANILFATVPADGHVNPLTALAVHLRRQGHEVRWYTGATYADKLHRLGIPHYPFRRALEITTRNFEQLFPERSRIKSQIGKLKFDLKHIFVARTPEYFEDIRDIQREFDFDVLVTDISFTAGPLVSERLHRPWVCMGIVPLPETSRDLAPYGLGLPPSTSFFGRIRQAMQRFVTRRFVFHASTKAYNQILMSYGLKPTQDTIFDIPVRRSDLYLQSGTPGFEYQRSDMSPKVRFVGPLLPHRGQQPTLPVSVQSKLGQYQKVILATQGTAEPEVEKLLIPTLEAFRNSSYLVVVTTGGSRTAELRERFPESNIVIEDFIDFDAIMPNADVYVTNGGYGGTLLAISHGLPMVCAGIHEGKSEINARVGFFELGINLFTEYPKAAQLQGAVLKVLRDPLYQQNVRSLQREFARYPTPERAEEHILGLLAARRTVSKERRTEGIEHRA